MVQVDIGGLGVRRDGVVRNPRTYLRSCIKLQIGHATS